MRFNHWLLLAASKQFDKLCPNPDRNIWWGGRFPPDGAWTPNGRMIKPCSCCGGTSVSTLTNQETGEWLWLCELHEAASYLARSRTWKNASS